MQGHTNQNQGEKTARISEFIIDENHHARLAPDMCVYGLRQTENKREF